MEEIRWLHKMFGLLHPLFVASSLHYSPPVQVRAANFIFYRISPVFRLRAVRTTRLYRLIVSDEASSTKNVYFGAEVDVRAT